MLDAKTLLKAVKKLDAQQQAYLKSERDKGLYKPLPKEESLSDEIWEKYS
jgi:hypothetical protein